MSASHRQPGIEVLSEVNADFQYLLSLEALAFLYELHRRFNPKRLQLLEKRKKLQVRWDAGEFPEFPKETGAIRSASWTVGEVPKDLEDRRVEITGPVERKMMINALNSGAKVFMADFEDATAPSWINIMEGQKNCFEAVRKSLSYKSPEGKEYVLNERLATLVVRPRGWHLPEHSLRFDGEMASGSLVDFGLYFFHNARELISQGSGPYFYLPKIEHYEEARLWNEVFVYSQEYLGIPNGKIKSTVLIETILAAYQMDEILYELKDHIVALNAGRWDYIFSIIKKFKSRSDFIFPDRAKVTMSVPFMRAYCKLLVQTCHKRGAHAIGGMAAFIPSRKDPEINAVALAKVKEDKTREVNDGFDGTWVAHPDLVPVAKAVFDQKLQSKPNQKDIPISQEVISEADLLQLKITGAGITEIGVRNNINVTIQYLEAWINGQGAVAIHSLMEDAATAEISRSELWQWLKHHAKLEDGRVFDVALYHTLRDDELSRLIPQTGKDYNKASALLDELVLSNDFAEFLTLGAYSILNPAKEEKGKRFYGNESVQSTGR